MTTQRKVVLTQWASIVTSVVVIAGGLSFGYDSFVAPKVQKQIDLRMAIHEKKQEERDRELKEYMAKFLESQIETSKSVARIEGKLEGRGR